MKKSVVVMGCVLPAAAMAMADRTVPVYGRPTLYGEYEAAAADQRRASAMYGVVPQNVAEKLPMKPKKPVSKNAVRKKTQKNSATLKKKSTPKVAKKAEKQDVIVVPLHDDVVPTEKVEQKTAAMPSDTAVAIAVAATVADTPSVEAFCTERRTLYRGKLPDGVILMPGRPDLMSCSDK